ncbi:MAG: hypothetical protein ABII12_03225 [Planctomycetota bacterium]
MAQVVDLKYSTLIGTPKRLMEIMKLLGGSGASAVDAKFCNLVVLDKPVTREQLVDALATTPNQVT